MSVSRATTWNPACFLCRLPIPVDDGGAVINGRVCCSGCRDEWFPHLKPHPWEVL